MKRIVTKDILNDWKLVQFNEKYENNWTLKYQIYKNEARLDLQTNIISNNYLVTESYRGYGCDFYEALYSLCINMGINIKDTPTKTYRKVTRKKTIKKPPIIRTRPLRKSTLEFYKEVVYRIYNYLIEQNLIIMSKENYNLYSLNHSKDIIKIKNLEESKKTKLDKCVEHLYFIDIVHLNTKDKDDVIELRKIHGRTQNKQYTANLLHNNNELKGIAPCIHYKLHDNPFIAKEYLEAVELENINKYPINIKYLLNPFKYILADRDGFINYSSKYIIYKIRDGIISDGRDGYICTMKCNLLGVRDYTSFESLQILDILEKTTNYLYQLLLDREKVSIARVYNRSLADFDMCFLDNKIGKQLKGILASRFIENFTN